MNNFQELDQSNGSCFANKVLWCKEDDYITTWKPTKAEKRYALKNGFSQEPVRVKVTKIKLSTGDIEQLDSNLFYQ